MLSELSTNPNQLLVLIRNAIWGYCDKYSLPRIPVVYGRVNKKSGLEFRIKHPAVIVSLQLPSRLAEHPSFARTWYLLQSVAHEMKHYEQYLKLRKSRVPIRKELFSEEEAYLAGYQHADDSIRKYSPEEINPMSKTNRNPVSLYQKFHGNPPRHRRRVNVPLPKKGTVLTVLGRMPEIRYTPYSPSQYTGTTFKHKWGDNGRVMLPDKPLLATDGKDFYIIKEGSNARFTGRGIIG